MRPHRIAVPMPSVFSAILYATGQLITAALLILAGVAIHYFDRSRP